MNQTPHSNLSQTHAVQSPFFITPKGNLMFHLFKRQRRKNDPEPAPEITLRDYAVLIYYYAQRLDAYIRRLCQDRFGIPQNDQVENPQNRLSKSGQLLLLCI